MGLIVLILFCIGSAFFLPFPISMFVMFGAALLRILFLTHESAIEAAAEVAGAPARLIADIKRNGMEVLRTIFGYSVIIAILCGIAFLCGKV